MFKDKSETSKPYNNSETLYQEHNEIDWSSPNEENGYYSHGTRGSRSWLETRRKSRTEIVAESLISRGASFLRELPKENPLAEVLSNEEWEEAREVAKKKEHRLRELAEEKLRHQALSMVENYYECARFGEGKDLQTAVQNTELGDLEEYAKALRYAALAFGELAHGLERGRRRKRLAVAKGDHE